MPAPNISDRLPRYTQYDPMVPVWCATPNTPRTIHRFFDSSPFSPSGRYLATTQLPYEDRLPTPGDCAQVVVTDLATGEERFVAETWGWDTQLGAQPHWGTDDRQLMFNELDTTNWTPYAVRLDLETGERTRLDGPIFAVSRDRRFAVTLDLRRTGLALAGYGVIVPPEFVPRTRDASDQDGIFRTDLTTGEYRLLVSNRALVDSLQIPYAPKAGEFVAFQVGMNPQADWVYLILRWVKILPAYQRLLFELWRQMVRVSRKAGQLLHQEWLRTALRLPQVYRRTLLVVRSDGSSPRVILPWREFAQGAHHPSWCPDGQTVLMNRVIDGRWRLARYHLEGDRWEVLSDRLLGSGHPTLHPNGRHIVTDAYVQEEVAYGDGTVPIRWIDWRAGTEQALVRILSRPALSGPRLELRVDPHPAWDESFTRLAFNAYVDGTRRVYVADLAGLDLSSTS